MAKHLLVPVGTNPVPVYVSARLLLGMGGYRSIHLLHSGDAPGRGTYDDAHAIERALSSHRNGAKVTFTPIADPGNPVSVRDATKRVIDVVAAAPGDGPVSLHFHHSGGTKTMVVFGWATVREECAWRQWDCEASYLDPRRDGGGRLVDSGGLALDSDARRRVTHAQPNDYLETLLGLHSMRAVGRVAARGAFTALGVALWGWTLADLHRRLGALQKWRRQPVGWNWGRNVVGRSIELGPVEFDGGVLRAVAAIEGAEIVGTTLRVRSNPAAALLSRAFGCGGGGFLEEAADAALTEALRRREGRTGRTNWFVAPEIRFAPPGIPDDRAPEIDLVCVLGYQALAVSCTTDGERNVTKQKAFEVLHRARQLGGDEARGIVLSGTDRATAASVENDVHDDIGSRSRPVLIWGRDKWPDLSRSFETYLEQERSW